MIAERRRSTGRRLRVVEETRAGRSRGVAPFLLVSTVLVGGLVLSVASLQALVSQNSFRMEDVARRNEGLRQEYGRLRLEVAQLSSPGRIAREAERLGLRLPEPTEVRTVQVGRRAGSRDAPGAGPSPHPTATASGST